jgi:hypothetical protein
MSQTRTRATDQKLQFENEEQWRAAVSMIRDVSAADVTITEDGEFLVFAFDNETKEKIGFFNKQRQRGYVCEPSK